MANPIEKSKLLRITCNALAVNIASIPTPDIIPAITSFRFLNGNFARVLFISKVMALIALLICTTSLLKSLLLESKERSAVLISASLIKGKK